MSLARVVPATIILLACLVPLSTSAQGNTEMEETIRASLYSDPRTAGMSEAEIDAMVALLSEEAVAEGVTPADIVWRPQEEVGASAVDATCTLTPRLLCALNRAFGFDGSATLIPILLGATSMALIVFFGYELERHYMRARAGKGTKIMPPSDQPLA